MKKMNEKDASESDQKEIGKKVHASMVKSEEMELQN
jgi:hypothetical protein